MKPSFALNLSHDGISLLHRAQAGWLSVGDVSLDAPNLMDELVVLRHTAADLEAGGLSTKLVIPNSQILYTEVDAPGPTKSDRIEQIKDALDGLTPYEVHELAFDWKVRKGKVQVAAVARDTLAEAETFAMQYRFNPVSFVAIPANGDFDGEPFFGETQHAERLLDGAQKVERDKRPIVVLGQLGDVEDLPAPEPKPKRVPKPKPDVQAEEAVAEPNGMSHALANGAVLEPVPEVSADAEGTGPEADMPVSFSSRRRAAQPLNGHAVPPMMEAAPPVAEAEAETSEPSKAAPEPVVEPVADVSEPVAKAPDPADAADDKWYMPPVTARSVPAADDPLPEPARKTPKVEELPPVPEQRADVAPSRPGDLPPIPPRRGPKPEDIAGIAAKRLESDAPETGAEEVLPPAGGDSPAMRAAAVNPEAPELAKKADPVLDKVRDPQPEEVKPARRFSLRRKRGEDAPTLAETLNRMRGGGAVAAVSAPAKTSPAPAPAARAKTPDPMPLPKPAPACKPRTPDMSRPVTPSASEAEAMTVFGARGKPLPKQRPRFLAPAGGLLLLVVLGAVALWLTYFMNDVASDWFGLRGDPEVTEIEEPAPTILPEAPSETATSSATEAPVAPSVPMPGVEVTALQPEMGEAPAAAAEEPEAVETTPEPVVPEAVPDESLLDDAVPADGVTAAVEEALAPETEPEASAVPEADGPGPDVATFAPQLPAGSTPETPAVPEPGDGGTAHDPLEIVRLDVPPAGEAAPQAEVSAPAPVTAVPENSAPPTADEAEAFYAETGISVRAPDAASSPGLDRLDDVVLSSADPDLAPPPSRGLPETEHAAPGVVLPFATMMPPLPPDIEFDLDERGLVRATEDGALTPDGIVVYQGEPAVVPPVRPGTEVPESEDDAALELLPEAETSDVAQEPETEVAAAEPVNVPELRPEDLAEDDAAPSGTVEDEFDLAEPADLINMAPLLDQTDLAEADERARFGGLTLDELAGVRPSLRPGEDLVIVAAEPEDGAEPEVTSDGAETDAAVTLALAETSAGAPETATDAVPGGDAATDSEAEAVAADVLASASVADTESAADGPLIDFASVVPPLRPGEGEDGAGETAPAEEEAAATEETPDFSDATERAVDVSLLPASRPSNFSAVVEKALKEAAAAPPPPSQPAPSNPSPVPATPAVRAPSIPTTAAVASTATEENALRLNRVNLIGVYGSSSNRRALVRLSSGRYVKVQVGDNVDGGQVAAIGDDELRYIKNGRTITLALPQG
ncbi:hypothetical protein [Pseudoruegeria sp. HB172150]|uniref:hypothetical protein n=1 Tax=Pseudoruegeria sp. HB172150 TaxID=2721164 RepID=UPI001555C5CB|nr:hypothetical protein [Pseudoruegeria sp. HB172150]